MFRCFSRTGPARPGVYSDASGALARATPERRNGVRETASEGRQSGAQAVPEERASGARATPERHASGDDVNAEELSAWHSTSEDRTSGWTMRARALPSRWRVPRPRPCPAPPAMKSGNALLFCGQVEATLARAVVLRRLRTTLLPSGGTSLPVRPRLADTELTARRPTCDPEAGDRPATLHARLPPRREGRHGQTEEQIALAKGLAAGLVLRPAPQWHEAAWGTWDGAKRTWWSGRSDPNATRRSNHACPRPMEREEFRSLHHARAIVDDDWLVGDHLAVDPLRPLSG